MNKFFKIKDGLRTLIYRRLDKISPLGRTGTLVGYRDPHCRTCWY